MKSRVNTDILGGIDLDDKERSKEDLINELNQLRKRNLELETCLNGKSITNLHYLNKTHEIKRFKIVENCNLNINDILSSIKEDFYVLDHDWNFVYTNKQFTSRIGKEPKDFVGKNIWEMFPKHIGTVYEENLREAMEKRNIQRFDVGGKYTEAYYRMAIFPCADGITLLGSDITQQKKVEYALSESEEKYRSIKGAF